MILCGSYCIYFVRIRLYLFCADPIVFILCGSDCIYFVRIPVFILCVSAYLFCADPIVFILCGSAYLFCGDPIVFFWKFTNFFNFSSFKNYLLLRKFSYRNSSNLWFKEQRFYNMLFDILRNIFLQIREPR